MKVEKQTTGKFRIIEVHERFCEMDDASYTALWRIV